MGRWVGECAGRERQLALPKRFETGRAAALLGAEPPTVREYWGRMIDHLLRTGWRGVSALTESAA